MLVFALLILFIIFLLFLVFAQVLKDVPIMEVRPSLVHGRGMFAKRNIPQGHLIEVAPIIKIDRERDITAESTIRNYDIKCDDGHAIMLGYGSIYNHSDDNNAFWLFMGDQLHVIAKKPIEKNEEIFVNYGPHYWNVRDDKKNIS